MTSLEIAKLYFDLSNKSDFEKIAELFSDAITYDSQNTGMFAGKAKIIAMQKDFHGQFAKLSWSINSISEENPGIVLVDYDFAATKPTGEEIKGTGLEYVTIQDGKIKHIEIKNK